MDAIQRWNALVLQVSGDALVCRKHEFFDDAVRDVALGAGHALHQSEFVEFDDGLRQIEIDRSPPLALAVEDHLQLAHQFEVWNEGGVTGLERLIAFQHGIHRRIGHALGGTDDPRTNFVSDNFPTIVDFHDAGHDQAIDLRAQAADISGEFQRQHRHGTVRKINAGSPQACFLIESGFRRDILRDVGDMNLQLETAVWQSRHQHGIVEVASGFSINGDNWETAEVAPGAGLLRRNDRFDSFRLVQNLVGEAVGQMIFANDDLNIHAEIILVAQDFYDTTAWILRRGWPVGDLDVDDHVFEISPFGATGSLFAEHAMFGMRRTSCVVRRAQLGDLAICALRVRRATCDGRRFFRIFHSLRNYDLMRNL